MCEPTTLLIAATAMQVAGQVTAGVNQSKAMKYSAAIKERNATMDRQAARDALERGRIEEQRQGRRTAQMIGAQRAAMGANGIALDFGSAVDVQEGTRKIGWQDAQTIRENARRESQGYEISAWNSRAGAAGDRAGAKGAMWNTAFSVGSTLLNAGQQYRKMQAQGG